MIILPCLPIFFTGTYLTYVFIIALVLGAVVFLVRGRPNGY